MGQVLLLMFIPYLYLKVGIELTRKHPLLAEKFRLHTINAKSPYMYIAIQTNLLWNHLISQVIKIHKIKYSRKFKFYNDS